MRCLRCSMTSSTHTSVNSLLLFLWKFIKLRLLAALFYDQKRDYVSNILHFFPTHINSLNREWMRSIKRENHARRELFSPLNILDISTIYLNVCIWHMKLLHQSGCGKIERSIKSHKKKHGKIKKNNIAAKMNIVVYSSIFILAWKKWEAKSRMSLILWCEVQKCEIEK